MIRNPSRTEARHGGPEASRLRVSAALGEAGVPFMLVGGFSSNFHGIPRSTQDADFVVQLNAPLNDAFAVTLGPGFEAEPQLSF